MKTLDPFRATCAYAILREWRLQHTTRANVAEIATLLWPHRVDILHVKTRSSYPVGWSVNGRQARGSYSCDVLDAIVPNAPS